ncbi:MAG: tetratricopeptide repeat protein [Burkholderiaceae bacterium]|jgi:Tfp pilus assembly protein PilF|nr:tetratricopeptide repeat protein [Burkholderiaceae bacterium]
MNVSRLSIVAAACSAALMSGCAQTGPKSEVPEMKVAPVYRVQQPAGTAAGQYAVGRIDIAEGRNVAAIERFRNALKLDPAFVDAHNGLGVAYGQQGRFEEAVEAFRSALAAGPATAHVLNNLGYAQMKSGRLADARESLRRSLELDPMNTRARENVSVLAALEQRDDQRAATVAAAVVGPVRAAVAPQIAVEAAPLSSARGAAALASSSESMLVRLAPNLYELRRAQGESGPKSASVDTAVSASVGAAAVGQTVAAGQMTFTPVAVSPSASSVAANGTLEAAPPTEPVAPPIAVATPLRHVLVESHDAASRSTPARADDTRSLSSARPVPTFVGRFEVSNGAGVERLAARTAVQFARFGVGISRISNYESFDRVRTEIHYRKGFLKQAQIVQQRLPVPAKLVASNRLRAEINVRLVVGRDMVQAPIAWWGDESVASAEPATKGASIEAAREAGFDASVAVAALDGWRHL